MAIVLSNNLLKIEIDEPGKPYIKSRFDWTGKITQVLFDNKYTFCTVEVPENLNLALDGQGLYNEFGIAEPIGFEDCAVGELFPKIGVGLLKRPDEKPYNFFREYEVEKFDVQINTSETEAVFITNPKNCRGYAIRLTKKFSLLENKLIIDYKLENTGSKAISTTEYCHNFIAVNHARMCEDYILKFPFRINPKRFEEIVNPDKAIQFDTNCLKFVSDTEQQFFFSPFINDTDTKEQWESVHTGYGVGVREITDFVPLKINVWGWKHVISPETFYQIKLNGNQKSTWKRIYEFFYL
jgi:hypothetical protein